MHQCQCGSSHHGGGSSHHSGGHMKGHGLGPRRRFRTKEEKIERLKNYADELRKEIAGIEERISEMNAGK